MDADPSDEALMLAYGQGDDQAFEVLYRRHGGGLYRYILRQSGHAAVAEELYQDVWLKLINSAKRYRPRAKFTTWLYHLAHNTLIDHYRRQGVRSAHTVSQTVSMPEPLAPAYECPDQQLQYQRLSGLLLDLIQDLPPEQRETFLLREEAGLSIEQIAELSGEKAETIKSRWRYAIGKLRRGLEGVK